MKRCLSCFQEYGDEFQVCPHCGQIEITEPKEPIHLIPGTIINNRYVIGLSVGAGGFGIVYKAYDLKLESIVAVKEFFVSKLMTRAQGEKNIIINSKSQVEYDYRKNRFLAEARTMAKFGGHRSIPNVFEFFEDNNTAYIVMELLEGCALNKYLNQNGGKLDVEFALFITNEVGQALISMHEKGIVHKDVAPDNIYICTGKDIRIKLMDLGAAKLADSTDEVIDIVLKPGYSPPEQYDSSQSIGPWTDVYALGATLYVMLTGVKPDESTNRKEEDIVVPPDQLNPLVSENLSNAIMKALAIEKHMRFKTVSDFLSAINGERKVIPLAKERKRRKTRRAFGIVAACIILAITAGLVAFLFQNKKSQQDLKKATISVWFSVSPGDTAEEKAMKTIADDFKSNFKNVTIELKAIPENEYAAEIEKAYATGKMPNLFESTDIDSGYLNTALALDSVLKSKQAKECLFLDQYDSYYKNKKKIPLAIEIPLAYVILDGEISCDYSGSYFSSASDFSSANVIVDGGHKAIIAENINIDGIESDADFLNFYKKSAVVFSSSQRMGEFKSFPAMTRKCVFFKSDSIRCRFTYEWSAGNGSKDENKAAEMFLSWMLGNEYQTYLMVAPDKLIPEIPVNENCFKARLDKFNINNPVSLKPIENIYNDFAFKKEDATK